MMSGEDGLVVRVQSRSFTVRVDGEEYGALVPKRLRYENPDYVDPVAVGDMVRLSFKGSDAVIDGIAPRTNAISRPASGRRGKRQLLAANLDLAVIVMAAAEPRWKTTTIDRYLVIAASARVPALICMNKVDLDSTVGAANELRVYRDLGIPLVWVSALTGVGVESLRSHLTGATGVLLGPSGTGKSTLLNRLVPDAGVAVGEISERTQKGRHTTSWVEMWDIPGGGRLLDSPGLRVLDLSGVDPAHLAGYFPEISELASECRFQDCRHMAEPGCRVKEGVENEQISRHRLESYQRIFESLEAGKG